MRPIFEYTDYRAYVRDSCEELKRRDPKFSHRYFAQKAGINSSGFLSNVLSGRRNLTMRVALRFAAVLKLNKEESDYFQNTVGYCQAKTVDERAHYYEKMIGRFTVEVRRLEQDKFEFYSKWYYSAIREVLYYFPFVDDYDALARQLNPSISAEEARKAVELLIRLNLLQRDAKGRLSQSTPLISSGGEAKSIHIARFQRETMMLAGQALDRFSGDVRDSSTLTMTLSEKSFLRAKKEVSEMRKRLLAIAREDQEVDRVYQFNFQLFPLTRFKKE
jgi:uncharacterized protein (TIGR02147 family)